MEWHVKTLDEVCLLITDGAHNSPKSVDVGFPMASVKDLTPHGINVSSCRLISEEDYHRLVHHKCQPHVGDVLIAKDGNSALDTVCEIKAQLDLVLLSSVAILRPNPNQITSTFLRYYLDCETTRQYLKQGFISGAAIPRVIVKDFKGAKITVPPLPTQRKIASILSAYDDLIENNTRRIAILEEMARAIYREWFVNFRFPGHENVKLVDSPLGQIPEGWEWSCLSDLGFIGRGKSRHRPRNAPELYGGPYPLFQTGDIKAASTFLWKHSQTYSDAGLAQSKLWEPGTLCITIAANIADTAILSKTACFPDSVVGFVSNPEQPCVYFVKLYLETIKRQMQNVSRGTTQDNLSLEKLLSFKVPTPTGTILSQFHAYVMPVFDNVLCLAKKNDNLRTTRDLLLPKLISGKLDVEDLDIDAGMTAEALEEATA